MKKRNKIEKILLTDYGKVDEFTLDKLCDLFIVSGSVLPEGFKEYICTDCGEVNLKKDNHDIRVGFCDNCDHPLWN